MRMKWFLFMINFMNVAQWYITCMMNSVHKYITYNTYTRKVRTSVGLLCYPVTMNLREIHKSHCYNNGQEFLQLWYIVFLFDNFCIREWGESSLDLINCCALRFVWVMMCSKMPLVIKSEKILQWVSSWIHLWNTRAVVCTQEFRQFLLPSPKTFTSILTLLSSALSLLLLPFPSHLSSLSRSK